MTELENRTPELLVYSVHLSSTKYRARPFFHSSFPFTMADNLPPVYTQQGYGQVYVNPPVPYDNLNHGQVYVNQPVPMGYWQGLVNQPASPPQPETGKPYVNQPADQGYASPPPPASETGNNDLPNKPPGSIVQPSAAAAGRQYRDQCIYLLIHSN